MGILVGYLDDLDRILHSPTINPYCEKLEALIKIQRKYIAGFLILLSLLGIVIGYASQLICNVIGFLYPAYESIISIESKDKKDDVRWLVYWVVYSTFCIAEYFSDWLLFWVPFYYFYKSGLLIWCMHPNYNGSMFIYSHLIRPLFMKHQNKLTQLISDAKNNSSGLVTKVIGEMGEIGDEVLNNSAIQAKMTEGLVTAAQYTLASQAKQSDKND